MEDLMAKLSMRNEAKDKLLNRTADSFRFWNTQPVPRLDEEIDETENGPIQESQDISEISTTPLKLPPTFEWVELDIENDDQLSELYQLLSENYVEDYDSKFRFDYTREVLRWALLAPGWKKEWHLGVRVVASKKLVAFISAVPYHMSIKTTEIHMPEINYLCIHKKLRSKRLAPVLIQEITRRVRRTGIFQAIYTSGQLLPKPITVARYGHRMINPKKLVQIGFSYLRKNMSMAQMVKLYRLPEKHISPGYRPFQKSDVKQVTKLLNNYLSKFSMRPIFSEKDVEHYFIPVPNAMSSFVIEDPDTKGKILGFTSFYRLPNKVIGHPVHQSFTGGYLYYYVPPHFDNKEMDDDIKYSHLRDLIQDTLISARDEGFDVVTCCGILDNKKFKEDLKFVNGDGGLHFYVFNWKCSEIKEEDNAFIVV